MTHSLLRQSGRASRRSNPPGRWKLIEFYKDNRIELYNLKQDPGERHDLAAPEHGRASEMRQRLHAWRAALGAVMPEPNPDYRPAAATN